MQEHKDRAAVLALLACLMLSAICVALAGAQQTQQPQQQGQQGQQQDQKDKDKDKNKNKDKDKDKQAQPGKSGLFGGMRRVTGMRDSKETQLTSSGGAKGVGPGDGKKIAEAKPTAEDRQKVDRMASASPTADEMKQFLEQGKLATEKKGGKQ